jgi:hypothetical protein
MRRAAFKALFALNNNDETRVNRDRVILIGSSLITIGLVALYAYGR